MKKALTFLAALLLPASVVQAHHSFSMFEREKQMALVGTVTEWAYNNPHVWLYIDVVSEDGEIQNWGFEGGAPPTLVRRGITGRTFEMGDEVTVMFSPLVDGRPGGAMCFVKSPDGEYHRPIDGGCGAREPDLIEKWERWIEMGITSSEDPRAK